MQRQFEMECSAGILLARHSDCAAVVGNHRLRDGQTQSRAELLSRVIRREKALTFFLRESRAGVCDFYSYTLLFVIQQCPEGDSSAFRHRIQGIKDKVLDSATKQH